jgi:hypothetical protein
MVCVGKTRSSNRLPVALNDSYSEVGFPLPTTGRGTQQDVFHLSGNPVARPPNTASASLWLGQNMLYSRPKYALNHTITVIMGARKWLEIWPV